MRTDLQTPPDRSSHVSLAIGVGALAVFLYALFAALEYIGLIRTLGEWQFATFGFYAPMLTVTGLTAVSVLVARLLHILLRRNRGIRVSAGQSRSAIVARDALFAISFLAGGIALAAAINLQLLPDRRGPARTLTSEGVNVGYEGVARLAGFRTSGPMARYTEGVAFWRRTIFIVPLQATGGRGDAPVSVFAEIGPEGATGQGDANLIGIMRRDAVPSELVPLYQAAGVRVAPQASVLFRDARSMAFGSIVLVAEATVIAVLALLAALGIHRVLQRASRRAPPEVNHSAC